MADILIIDDDPVICELLEQLMEKVNHRSRYALTGAKGLELAEAGRFDIVFLDVKLSDVNGLELIQPLKQLAYDPEIIIITGERDPDGADLAITSGAWNYLEKPFYRQEINLQVSRALAFRKEKGNVSGPGGFRRYSILGDSPAISRCLTQAAAASGAGGNVLISGGSGTGKTTFAKTIHLNSDRWEGNLVAVDCAALDDDIAAKALFGSGKAGKKGLAAMAHNGTLLLEDVDQLPRAVQPALTRAMETRSYTESDTGTVLKSCFRVIATTQLTPAQIEQEGQISTDLFFSLGGARLRLPALARRKGDAVTIAMHYMEAFCRKLGLSPKGISPECLDIIRGYHWPGNVRELVHAMDRAVSTARQEPTLYSVHLPAHIKSRVIRQTLADDEQGDRHEGILFREEGLKTFLKRKEEEYISRLYRRTNGNVEKASRIAGISKSGFYAKLKKHNLN